MSGNFGTAKDSRIFVAGSKTLIGKSLIFELRSRGYQNLTPSHEEPDLTNQLEVERFFIDFKPEYVFLAGGKSGGIQMNQEFPADLIRENLLVETHVIHEAYRNKVKKLLYLASSCCYPKFCGQPMQVEALFTGKLEPTNEAYAAAKLAGVVLCQSYRFQHKVDFITVIPANPFGPGDDFKPKNSHVIPSLLRKMHEAKNRKESFLEIWGTGAPIRDFIFSRDLADACLFLMEQYDEEKPINVGSGTGCSISELSHLIKEVVGYPGELFFNPEKPDGMPIKVLDSSQILKLGWKPKTSLEQGIKATYGWFLEEMYAAKK